MPGEQRTEREIRGEIATEREQLAEALADFREGIAAKRRPAARIAAALAAVLAAVIGMRIVRRLERR